MRATLGQLLFSGDDQKKMLSVISGGASALLALFERSPLGVLRALDSAKRVARSDPARHKAISRVIDQLLA